MQNNLKHKISLVVGDHSCNGHEKQESYELVSNLSKQEIEAAYKKGVKVVGFDLTKEVAVEYEKDKLSKKQLEMLLKAECPFQEISFDYEYWLKNPKVGEGFSTRIHAETFCALYLWFVEKGNSSFKYQFANSEKINIGGYGCFY